MNKAYEEIRPYLRVVLRSKASQGDKLSETIHTELCDMALLPVLRIKCESICSGQESNGIAYMKKSACEKLDVSEEQIMEDALKNTVTNCPSHTEGLSETLVKLRGVDASEIGADIAESHMFVATNVNYNNGAAVLAYPGFMEEMSERLEDNLIIIPSSIHEVIVIRESEMDGSALLNEWIKDVNHCELESCDILSDHAYRYDATERKLEVLIS
ncbi:MAG: hypothetical protein J6M92_02320 [Oribacterium sp.]|nr:hypothetical protein [Oribacterium sp.]